MVHSMVRIAITGQLGGDTAYKPHNDSHGKGTGGNLCVTRYGSRAFRSANAEHRAIRGAWDENASRRMQQDRALATALHDPPTFRSKRYTLSAGALDPMQW